MEEGLHRQQQVILNLSEIEIEGLSICLCTAAVANKNSKTIPGGSPECHGHLQKVSRQLTKRDYNYHKHQFNLYKRHECEKCFVFDWTDGVTNTDIFRSCLRWLCVHLSLQVLLSSTATNRKKPKAETCLSNFTT